MVSIVAGGGGFIGSNLIESLLLESNHIVIIDNFSRGHLNFLNKYPQNRVHIISADLSFADQCMAAFNEAAYYGQIKEVWHLAANSDIPAGVKDPRIDLNDTFMTSFNILVSMKQCGIQILHFASSSAIYGDLGSQLLHEDIGPLFPISNYGAMKLASEAQIYAAGEAFLSRINIFRFPNVVGVPATHGVILDFINKLINTPSSLQVLGDGTQQKSYLHVSDLISAMLVIRGATPKKQIQVVNIGPLDEGVTVQWIAEQVVKRVCPGAKISYGEGNKGWVGDVPKFNYSTKRLQSFGWAPKLNSAGAVELAIDEIALQLGR